MCDLRNVCLIVYVSAKLCIEHWALTKLSHVKISVWMEMEPGHIKKGRIPSPLLNAVQTIGSHDLARHLHGDNNYFLLDCRPVLAYNSCHISGAVNVNFTGMIKKRFIAGKIGLPDLFSQEAKEKFKVCLCL